MRADDDTLLDLLIRRSSKAGGHKGCRLAHRHNPKRSSLQAGRDVGLAQRAINQVMRRRRFDRAARDRQEVFSKNRQGRNLSGRSSDRSSPKDP
jgi:hypothetical protein